MDIREIETLIHKTIKALYLAKDINFLENNLADDINWIGAGEIIGKRLFPIFQNVKLKERNLLQQ